MTRKEMEEIAEKRWDNDPGMQQCCSRSNAADWMFGPDQCSAGNWSPDFRDNNH